MTSSYINWTWLKPSTWSRQAVLDECSVHFPEILSWVSWCYGSHPELWHPMGHLSLQPGVQQVDPLGPMLFSLVLQKLVATIDADEECLLLQAWYLDDGMLAGKWSAILRVLHLIEELGHHMGLFVSYSNCEVFSPQVEKHRNCRDMCAWQIWIMVCQKIVPVQTIEYDPQSVLRSSLVVKWGDLRKIIFC